MNRKNKGDNKMKKTTHNYSKLGRKVDVRILEIGDLVKNCIGGKTLIVKHTQRLTDRSKYNGDGSRK